MPARTCLTIVLAAGEGTRMRSSRPKVLHSVGGRTLLAHVLSAAASAHVSDAALVIGADAAPLAAQARALAPDIEIAVQSLPCGTAHAALAAKDAIARG